MTKKEIQELLELLYIIQDGIGNALYNENMPQSIRDELTIADDSIDAACYDLGKMKAKAK